MGWRGDRPLPYHWIYLVEAAVIAAWVRELGISHLHAHFGSNPAEVAMLAAALSGVPYSFTSHGTVETDNPQAMGIAEKVKRAAFAVAVSHYGRAQMMRWVGSQCWSKIHVVRCGLGADFLTLSASPVPSGARFLAVGRLSEEKGHLVLVDALAIARRAGQRFELVLAGDGPLRAALEARIRELDLGDCVRITGWVSGQEVIQLLQTSRALVLPSFAEGLPVVIMEAFALARPVVSSWVAGVPELVRNGSTGWLVAPGDAEGLARALTDCAAAPVGQLGAMGLVARDLVRQQHDSAVEANKLAELFLSVEKSGRTEEKA
jgi:glycosyltransferase involved in cell wall biosynthesis